MGVPSKESPGPPSCPLAAAPWGGWGGIWELFPKMLLINAPQLGSGSLAPKAPGENAFGLMRYISIPAAVPPPSPQWGWPLAMGLGVLIWSPPGLGSGLGAVGRSWNPAGLLWGWCRTWVGGSPGCPATGA